MAQDMIWRSDGTQIGTTVRDACDEASFGQPPHQLADFLTDIVKGVVYSFAEGLEFLADCLRVIDEEIRMFRLLAEIIPYFAPRLALALLGDDEIEEIPPDSAPM